MMASERWQQIDDLFEAALDRPRDSRRLFLESQQDISWDVVAEVIAMIAADERVGDFMDDGAADAAADLIAEEASAAPIPDRIGPLKVLEQIARGGMGSVYLAERDDGTFVRRVAVKVLQPGFDAPAVRRRFLSERQILASLEHENVARIYDGGILDDGRPYFVMEFVDGLPLDRHCEEHSCSLDKRLSLLLDVADTVQFAHRNLVVHRDIKPSNILVTDDGHVKLLDFGIAKVLEGEGGDGSVTQTGTRWMTPEYAAPEQILGEPATTATDVYQLGVIAYQILTGVKPFPGNGRSVYEVQRAVCEDDPERPSIAAPSKQDGSQGVPYDLRRLKGDLDAVVMKALRKQPEDRYVSASDFADDIRKYLGSKPVKARRGSAAYRARKYFIRNTFGVAVALAAAFAIGGYIVTLNVQQQRIEREVRKARRVTAVLTSIFSQADPYDPENKDRVEAAIKILDPVVAGVVNGLEDEAEVQAELFFELGTIYRKLGRDDKARQLLRQSIDRQEAISGPKSVDVAKILAEYARVVTLDSTGQVLERAVSIWESAGDHVDGAEVARAELRFAATLESSDPRRKELTWRAMERVRRAYGDRSLELARVLNTHYGTIASGEAIIEVLEEALDIFVEKVGEEHRETAETLANLAMAHDALGHADEGLRMMRRAYEISVKAEGLYHPNVSLIAIDLGAMLHEAGRFSEADSMFMRALDARLQTSPDRSDQQAFARYWLGLNATATGNYAKAERNLRMASEIWESALDGPPNDALLFTWNRLANCLRIQERYDEAERLALITYEHVKGDPRRLRLEDEVTAELVSLYEDWGRPEMAEPYRKVQEEGNHWRSAPE